MPPMLGKRNRPTTPRSAVDFAAGRRAAAWALLALLLASAPAAAGEWQRCDALSAGGFTSNDIRAIGAGNGGLWVGTAAGLAWTQDAGRTWEVAQLTGAAAFWTSPKSEYVAQRMRALRAHITVIAATDKAVWVGTLGGLCMSRDGKAWFVFGAAKGLPGAAVWDVAAAGDEIWAATSAGLYRSTDGGSSWLAMTPAAADEKAEAIEAPFRPRFVALGDGAAYVAGFDADDVRGGAGQLFKVSANGRTWRRIDFWNETEAREPAPSLHRLYADGDQVWLCTAKGAVFSVNAGNQWRQATIVNGLPSDDVLAAARIQRTIWLATADGICWSINEGERWETEPAIGGRVNGLTITRTALWLSTDGGLLKRLAGGARWESFSSRQDVRAIAVQRLGTGRVWWAGTTGGLSRSDDEGQTWRTFSVVDGMPSNCVLSLAVQGRALWAGTEGGVCELVDGGATLRTYRHVQGLIGTRVADLAVVGPAVWGATDRGLVEYRRELGRWRTWMPYISWLHVAGDDDGLYATTTSWVQAGRAPAPFRTLRPPVNPYVHLLRSTNGGQDWEVMSIDEYAGGAVYDLQVDSGNVWLASSTGLYRSRDRGQSWCAYRSETLWGSMATCLAPVPDGRVFVQAGTASLFTPYGLWSSLAQAKWQTVRPRLNGAARVAAVDRDTLLAGNADGLFVLRDTSREQVDGRPGRLPFLEMAYLAASKGAGAAGRRVVSTIDPYAMHKPTVWVGFDGVGLFERGFAPLEPRAPAATEAHVASRDVFVPFNADVKKDPAAVSIRALAAGPHDLWIGLAEAAGAFDRLSQWTRYAPQEDGLHGAPVQAVAVVGDETWLGTPDGISILNRATGAWRYFTTENAPLPKEGVTALAASGDRVWVGTARGALLAPPDIGWQRILVGGVVLDIAIGRNIVCLGTDRGLYVYDPAGKFEQRLDSANSKLLSDRVERVFIEGNDVWAAAGGALVRLAGIRAAGGEDYAVAPSVIGPEGVVVVVNEASAGSIKVGEHYARVRGVPAENICRIRCATDETISRAEFEEHIRRPLWRFLHRNQLDRRISFIVTTYGVPLRIAPAKPAGEAAPATETEAAAVDSELCLVGRVHALAGPIPNGFLHRRETFSSTRFGFFLVCRLDGPTPEIAMRLVDDAVQAEGQKDFGAEGWATFDLDPSLNPTSGFIDNTILANYNHLRREERYKGRLRLESTERPLNGLNEARDTFFYLGWLDNQYRPQTFSWKKGAIGVQFHPLSAQMLRDAKASWLAGALADGLDCGIGSVYPTPPVALNAMQDLFHYLQMGYTWGESAYMSLRFLSWQQVVVGDPLYRPLR